MQLVEQFKQQCLSGGPGRPVVVVGAGVSIGAVRGAPQAAVASWQGLLGAGVARCVELGRITGAEAARLGALVAGSEPREWTAAAQAVCDALGGPTGGDYAQWLRETVGSLAGQVQDRTTLAALASLGRAGFILATTNYDGLLAAETGHRAVTWQERGLVERVLRGDERGIIHLHGHWERPTSVVFGDDDYDAVVGDEHAQAVLRALRMMHTLVLVGHGAGLGDPNWSGFLRWTERVFAGSEYPHYRLVRESEREAVQAQHPPAQRVFAVPYGAEHADLAPFLRSLAPEVPASGGDARTAVLLVNLTVPGQIPANPAVVKAQLGWSSGDPWVEYQEQVADFARLDGPDWRRIAAELDRCVAELRALTPSPARLMVVGQAPNPVFMYLGQQLKSCDGIPVGVLHLHRSETPKWEQFMPLEPRAPSTPDIFVEQAPSLGEQRRGRVVLAITCAVGQVFRTEQVKPMIEAAGGSFLAAYAIHNPNSQLERVMERDDLFWLRRHVEATVGWFGTHCTHDGVVVAFGGPSWAALFVGRWLNPRVNGTIEMPNFIPSTRQYVPALSWPMQEVPWVHPPLRVLVALAEPNDAVSIRASRERSLIERSCKPASARVRLEVLGAAQVKELVAMLQVHRPHVLHISGHGGDNGEIGLENAVGDCQKLHLEQVGALLETAGVRPALVVLSACHLGNHVEPLRRHAAAIVGVSAALHLKYAEAFVEALYAGIVRGESIKAAVDQARIVATAAYPIADPIQLQVAEGADASKVILLAPVR